MVNKSVNQPAVSIPLNIWGKAFGSLKISQHCQDVFGNRMELVFFTSLINKNI